MTEDLEVIMDYFTNGRSYTDKLYEKYRQSQEEMEDRQQELQNVTKEVDKLMSMLKSPEYSEMQKVKALRVRAS